MDMNKLILDAFLPYRLNVLANLTSTALAQVYSRQFGISIPEWRVLVTLGQNPDGEGKPVTQKAVCAHTHLDKTKMSRAVTSLEGRKLLLREVNGSDRREAFLSLTPSGFGLLAEITPLALAFAKNLEDCVSGEELAIFNQVLTALTNRARGSTVTMSQVIPHPAALGPSFLSHKIRGDGSDPDG